MRGRDAGNTPTTLTWRMRDEQELEAATPTPHRPSGPVRGGSPVAGGPGKLAFGGGSSRQRLQSQGNAAAAPATAPAAARRGGSEESAPRPLSPAQAALSCRPLSSSASRRRLNQRPGGKGAKRSSPRRAAFEVSAGRGGWLRGLGEGTENNQRSPPSWSLGICSRPFVGAETCVSNVGEAPSPRTPASSQGGVYLV